MAGTNKQQSGWRGWLARRSSESSHQVDPPEELLVNEEREPSSVDAAIPWSLRVAAAWSWRFLIVGIALAGLGFLILQIKIIVIPALIALLLAVLLEPLLRFLSKTCRLPRTLAAVISLLLGLVIVLGLTGVASTQIIANMPHLFSQARGGVDAIVEWLIQSPLNFDRSIVVNVWQDAREQLTAWVSSNTTELASGAFGVFSSATTLLTGLLMCLFCLFFFLKDGRRMWQWALRMLPVSARSPLNEAAIRGWVTLGSYARTQMLVAAIDAVGIGIGAWLLDVPMALPIGVLVFFASFVPIVGAIATGAIAVAIALVTQGPGTAVAMLVVILAVQQIESNLLQPFLMSSAVSLHPVAVLLVVAAGGYLADIIGAVFAVPILAFVNSVVLYLKGYDKYLALNYDADRPGGAPGTLEVEMAEAARPDKANIESALKAREEARANGTLRLKEESVIEAGKAQKEVQQALAQFDDAPGAPSVPDSAKPEPEDAEAAKIGAAAAEDPMRDVEKDD